MSKIGGEPQNCFSCNTQLIIMGSNLNPIWEYFCDDGCYDKYQDNEENKIYCTYKEKIYIWNNDFDDEDYGECNKCDKWTKRKDFEPIEQICYRCFMKVKIFIWKWKKKKNGDKNE